MRRIIHHPGISAVITIVGWLLPTKKAINRI